MRKTVLILANRRRFGPMNALNAPRPSARFCIPETRGRNTRASAHTNGVPPPPPPRGFAGVKPFELERYFAKYEFNAPYLLCCSDAEPLLLEDLLGLADPDAMARWRGLRLGYTETQGLPALREEIAAKHYSTIEPDELVVMAPEEGVFLFMSALLSPGDHVVVTYPGYQSLYELAEGFGCEVSKWEARPTPAGQAFDVSDLKGLVREDTKLVVWNFPHNPTGFNLTKDQLTEALGVAEGVGAYVFSDEMYRFLEYDTATRLPAACDLYDRAVSLSGLSKTIGLPGLRLGWLAAKDRPLLHRIMELKDYTTICNSAPSEILGLIGLRAQDQLLDRSLSLVRSNLQRLRQFFLARGTTFLWDEPTAGTVAFPRLIVDPFSSNTTVPRSGRGGSSDKDKDIDGSRVDIQAFSKTLVDKAGVLILPAHVYGHGPSIDRGHFRVGFGRKDMGECLTRVEAFLDGRKLE